MWRCPRPCLSSGKNPPMSVRRESRTARDALSRISLPDASWYLVEASSQYARVEGSTLRTAMLRPSERKAKRVLEASRPWAFGPFARAHACGRIPRTAAGARCSMRMVGLSFEVPFCLSCVFGLTKWLQKSKSALRIPASRFDRFKSSQSFGCLSRL